jgi:hypothetical protein
MCFSIFGFIVFKNKLNTVNINLELFSTEGLRVHSIKYDGAPVLSRGCICEVWVTASDPNSPGIKGRSRALHSLSLFGRTGFELRTSHLQSRNITT